MRSAVRFRLVLDTNTLLRGLVRPESASGLVLAACEHRQVNLLLSRAVVAEYRAVLFSSDLIKRNSSINAVSVELLLRRLRYFSEYTDLVKVQFRFDRDPLDEKFIELAIAARATHIVTHDNDLLSLSSMHDDSAKRFRQRVPGIRVLQPFDFLREMKP